MLNLFAEKLARALEKPARLPTFPAVALEISAVIEDPKGGLDRVARVVAKDPVLTARVMRLAASAAFGGASAPDSILAAVARIGSKGVREVVLLEGLRRTFPPTRKVDHRAFWKHSLATGFMTEALGQVTDVATRLAVVPGSLFMAGLLHDIGLALYMTIDEVSLIELLALRGEPGDSLETIERSYLGISHIDAGLTLCHAWRLPEVVAAAVAGHHDPGRAPAGTLRAVAQLVHVADYLCAAQGLGDFGEQRPVELQTQVTTELGLSESRFPALLRSVGETARRLDGFEI